MVGFADTLEEVLGARSAAKLASELDLHTVGDLLRHYPRRYAERGQLTPIGELVLGEHVTVLARVASTHSRQMRKRKGTIQTIVITDGRDQLALTFFNQAYKARHLRAGMQGLFAGKVRRYRGTLELVSPDLQLLDGEDGPDSVDGFVSALIPVYPATTGLETWTISRCVRQVLDVWDASDDPLPAELLFRHRLPDWDAAMWMIHRPSDRASVETARRRLAFDEAMAIALTLAQRRSATGAVHAPACPSTEGALGSAFDARVPFELTGGQREVGQAIAADLQAARPMNRLLQGEVGSGKTLVALRAMLQVIDAGKQAAMLAPTEVLAAQHADSLRELLGDLARAGELGSAGGATRVSLLTGSTAAKRRRAALAEIAGGGAGIVVGTHALLQDAVSFADLGLVVVDEQHRFGVEQRDALRRRGQGESPHLLVMTATPIPRTVAMTVYGDLDVSSLRELPHGRAPIATTVVPAGAKPAWLDRAWQRVREEVTRGHQVYVVCPRVGDDAGAGENGQAGDSRTGLSSATEAAAAAGTAREARPPLAVLDVAATLSEGPLVEQRVGVLHGRLAGDEKDAVMRAFTNGELDVLVATTVIEVGVDVANATMMVVMDAEHFGVSQLHQLRGRVGRGHSSGICLLVTESPDGSAAMRRLESVAATNDGFELAQLDLQLRREGDILGATQSGRRSGLRMLSLLRDEELIAAAREAADALVATDPALAAHPRLATLARSMLEEDSEGYLSKA
jgi:ATP-dependent DNA helicase RecG